MNDFRMPTSGTGQQQRVASMAFAATVLLRNCRLRFLTRMALPMICAFCRRAVRLLTRAEDFENLLVSYERLRFFALDGDENEALLGSHPSEKPRRVFSCLLV